jgi:hypothetical protein
LHDRVVENINFVDVGKPILYGVYNILNPLPSLDLDSIA